jgi:hypothetical protein
MQWYDYYFICAIITFIININIAVIINDLRAPLMTHGGARKVIESGQNHF